MIERNRFLDWMSHGILLLGVVVVAFPVYVTFVASTHTMQEVVQVPMPSLPGEHFLENYASALLGDRNSSGISTGSSIHQSSLVMKMV